ncbi:MAG TPA: TonB family protein [Thermoanaerobaculia bacterium]|nr:TonB family protein [Thermoanaerobaculia bacterium]
MISPLRAATALAALLLAAPALAQTSPVPPALQATTFDKIFDFDRALGDRVTLKVLLVHDGAGGGRDAAVALQGAFTAAAIAAEPVALPAAAARFRSGTVAYLLPGAATPELLEAAASAKVLTICGDAALAEQGKASVGLALRGDKAEIVVNLDRVAQEGHDFSAQLLKFARVVRGGAVASAGSPGGPGSPGGAAEGPAPVLVSLTKPEYPAVARRLRLEGDVVMRLSVDASGKVTDVELVKGLGRAGVDEAAMAAARTARFKPAIRNGSPVPSRYLLVIPFRL